jgi:hypothetical protein
MELDSDDQSSPRQIGQVASVATVDAFGDSGTFGTVGLRLNGGKPNCEMLTIDFELVQADSGHLRNQVGD